MEPKKLFSYLGLATILLFLLFWGTSKYRKENGKGAIATICIAIAVFALLIAGPIRSYFAGIHSERVGPSVKSSWYASHADSAVYAETTHFHSGSVTRH